MNKVKISREGTIQLPQSIMRKLNLQPGSEVSFIEDNKGNVVLRNPSIDILAYIECAFIEEASYLGIRDESDCAAFVREYRKEKRG